MPLNLEQMLKILSPVRPQQVRMASGLGSLAAMLRGGRQPAGQLLNQLYDSLAKRGVPLRQENGWTTMELPEGILNAIKNEGLLNYKRGGVVR